MTQSRMVVHAVRGRRVKKTSRPPVYRYSKKVGWIKRSLWGVIALVVVSVVAVATLNTGDGGARLVFSSSEVGSEMTDNIMSRPHYQGVDDSNQPFTVTADKATQLDARTVLLDEVTADVTQNDGQWLALKAKKGKYDTESRLLWLSEGISLFAGDGFEFRTPAAEVNLATGMAEGVLPVEGQGSPGTITANGFTADNNLQVIRFNGSVRMVLYP